MACDKSRRADDGAWGSGLGLIVHNEDCTEQSIVLVAEGDLSGVGAWYPALIFDLNTKQRDMRDRSRVDLKGNYHVAEHYTLGMDVPMPPPRLIPCEYNSEELMPGTTCPCGCGREVYYCDCNGYCDGNCEQVVIHEDDLCSDCLDHSTCDCECMCSRDVYCDGEKCGDCNYTALCIECRNSHDLRGRGLCQSCLDDVIETELATVPE